MKIIVNELKTKLVNLRCRSMMKNVVFTKYSSGQLQRRCKKCKKRDS